MLVDAYGRRWTQQEELLAQILETLHVMVGMWSKSRPKPWRYPGRPVEEKRVSLRELGRMMMGRR